MVLDSPLFCTAEPTHEVCYFGNIAPKRRTRGSTECHTKADECKFVQRGAVWMVVKFLRGNDELDGGGNSHLDAAES